MTNKSLTIAIVATAALMLVATSAVATEDVFAGKKKYKSQAISQANACGNGFMPSNVGCQNLGSQIQGDENVVAQAAVQELFKPEPKTAILEVCKDISGGVTFPLTVSFTVSGNNPSPNQFDITFENFSPAQCTDVTIGQGDYTVLEAVDLSNDLVQVTLSGECIPDPNMISNNSFRASGEMQSGETQNCTFENELFGM